MVFNYFVSFEKTKRKNFPSKSPILVKKKNFFFKF